MRGFLDNLTSPAWWLGVVVVGLAINLASSYLKPRIDQALGTVSQRVRLRTAARAARHERMVQRANQSQHAQIFLAFDELRHYVRALAFTVFMMGAWGMSLLAYYSSYGPYATSRQYVGIGFQVLGTLAFFLAIRYLGDASEIDQVLREAQDKHDTK